MKRRLLTVATLTPVGVLGVSGLAFAFWTVASSGAAGTAAVDSLAAPATVSTSNVSATSVTINVGAGPASGPSPTSYRVDRTAPSAASSVCTITGSTGSCVDASPVSGQTNTYAVFSRLGTSWVSGTSATTSASVPSTDTTAPTTTATASPAPNGAGWNNANVSVALAATDNSGGSGVKQITYSASGAQPIGSTTVSGASTSVSITTEGTTTISYFATDNANNIESTKTVTIKLDKTAPSAPSALTLTTATDTGSSNTDGTTSNTAPTFTGTAEANATIALFNGATQVGTGTTNGSGTFTATISPALAQGSYNITAKATDAAGNTSGSSAGKSIVIDSTAPAPASVVAANNKTLGQIDHAGTNTDTLTFTYSEANGMSPASVVTGWDGTGTKSINVTFTNGGASNDSITVPGIGTVTLGSTGWLTGTSTQAEQLTFVSPNTFVVTIINDPTGNATGVAASNFTWSTTGGTATDVAGNAASGSVTTNTQRF